MKTTVERNDKSYAALHKNKKKRARRFLEKKTICKIKRRLKRQNHPQYQHQQMPLQRNQYLRRTLRHVCSINRADFANENINDAKKNRTIAVSFVNIWALSHVFAELCFKSGFVIVHGSVGFFRDGVKPHAGFVNGKTSCDG